MICGIHHVAVVTPDADRLSSFYCKLFGFEIAYDGGWQQGSTTIDAMMALRGSAARVMMLRSGTAFVEIFQFSSPEQPARAQPGGSADYGYTHFCVSVVDITAEYLRLSGLGMVFHAPPAAMGGGLTAAYGRDPDGNIIELLEIADENFAFHSSRRFLRDQAGS